MENATLPIELVSLTLKYLIKSHGVHPRGIGETVQLRLISKDINAEIERLLFVDALLDIETFRQADCLQCIRIVRAERPHKALNRPTCMRYMVALFGVRDLPRWDMRIKQWTIMKQAIQELSEDSKFVKRVCSADARVSKDALNVLDFVKPRGATAEAQLIVSRAFADGLVTLLGVRDTWATFGPHHDSCGTLKASLTMTVNFWKAVITAHVGEEHLVQECLRNEGVIKSKLGLREEEGDTARNLREVAPYLSATLTVAVRQGHRNVIEKVLALPGAKSERVLINTKYFNKSSVLYAAASATNHEDRTVAQTALGLVDEVLGFWARIASTGWSERLLVTINTTTTKGRQVFERAVRVMLSETTSMLPKQVFLEVALRGDLGKTRFLFENIEDGRILTNAGTNFDWSDEYGVGLDRVIAHGNIFTIAVVMGHVDLLHLFKKYLDKIALLWFRNNMSKDKNESMKHWRQRDASLTIPHPVRDAVNDVFIRDNQLPGKKFRAPPTSEALQALLELAPEGMSWGAEVVACAGLSRPEYLQELLRVVNLDDWFPDKINEQDDRLTLEGAKAVTIGERALQHALRNVRADNVKILLEHGAKLAEDIKIAAPIFLTDEKQIRERDRIRKILTAWTETHEGAERIAWTSRLLEIDYYGAAKNLVSAEDVEHIEKDDRHFKWQVGNKSRGRHRPTAFVTYPGTAP